MLFGKPHLRYHHWIIPLDSILQLILGLLLVAKVIARWWSCKVSSHDLLACFEKLRIILRRSQLRVHWMLARMMLASDTARPIGMHLLGAHLRAELILSVTCWWFIDHCGASRNICYTNDHIHDLIVVKQVIAWESIGVCAVTQIDNHGLGDWLIIFHSTALSLRILNTGFTGAANGELLRLSWNINCWSEAWFIWLISCIVYDVTLSCHGIFLGRWFASWAERTHVFVKILVFTLLNIIIIFEATYHSTILQYPLHKHALLVWTALSRWKADISLCHVPGISHLNNHWLWLGHIVTLTACIWLLTSYVLFLYLSELRFWLGISNCRLGEFAHVAGFARVDVHWVLLCHHVIFQDIVGLIDGVDQELRHVFWHGLSYFLLLSFLTLFRHIYHSAGPLYKMLGASYVFAIKYINWLK